VSDATFIGLFVEEATGLLALFEDAGSGDEQRARAVADLRQAIMLLEGTGHAADAVRACDRLAAGEAGATAELVGLIRTLRAVLSQPRSEPPPPSRTRARSPSRRPFDTEESKTLRSFFRDEAHEHLEKIIASLGELGGAAPGGETLEELLRATHLLKGSAGTVGLTEFASAAHRLEETLARTRSGALEWSGELAEAVVEVIDALLAFVDNVEVPSNAADLELRAAALERLSGIELTVAPPRPAQSELESDAAADDDDDDDDNNSGGQVVGPLATDDTASVVFARQSADTRQHQPQILRVDPQRIDRLMDGVGELIFDRTRIERRIAEIELYSENLSHGRRVLRDSIEQLADSGELSDDLVVVASQLSELEADIAAQVSSLRQSTAALVDDAQALRRTTSDLQRGLTGIRMQSVATLFERLAPRVRAMARAEGKRVKLQLIGGETEFDKAVAEQVADALVQLLRNAVAHGIESAAERRAAGKAEIGLITLAARGEGESVAIEITDDGSGLDTPALRRRLVEQGVWSEQRAELESDNEVLRAVFFSGVSSRDTPDLLAGRGVGLGAVRETVARLGGEIRLSSTPRQGTTFTVRLPLTTAVAHALLFKVGGHVYAVPNVNVVETAMVEASGPAIPSFLRIRSASVPLILLHAILGADIPADARTVPAVVIEYLGKRLAITCDKIVGPREIVVKSLGPLLASMPLYAGGTVSGSGKVQLILDPAALVSLAFPRLEVLKAPTHPVRAVVESRRPRRLLLVDDSKTVRESLTRALERAGFVVDVAADGAAAWERLCTSSYDALVTDIEMPELDGFGLIEKVRAELAELPTVIISSAATDENRARAAELGVRTVLAKPVNPQAIAEALR
jgi:chemotaxis protein histidine kinase CheA